MSGNPETLTNAAGVVVFEGTTSESGGSQANALVVYSLPFSFDTPGLKDGLPIFVPEAGDLSKIRTMSITTAFDGANLDGVTSPRATFFYQGESPTTEYVSQAPDGISAQVDVGFGSAHAAVFNWQDGDGQGFYICLDSTPLLFAIDNGTDGGDPESSHGTGVAYIVVARPSPDS